MYFDRIDNIDYAFLPSRLLKYEYSMLGMQYAFGDDCDSPLPVSSRVDVLLSWGVLSKSVMIE